jgi:hypothetical protein
MGRSIRSETHLTAKGAEGAVLIVEGEFWDVKRPFGLAKGLGVC